MGRRQASKYEEIFGNKSSKQNSGRNIMYEKIKAISLLLSAGIGEAIL